MTLYKGAFHRPANAKAFWRARLVDPDSEDERELGRVRAAALVSSPCVGYAVTITFEFGGPCGSTSQAWPLYDVTECSATPEELRAKRLSGDDYEPSYRVGSALGLTYLLRTLEVLRVGELHKAVGREVWCIRDRQRMIVAMEQKGLDGGLVFIPSELWTGERWSRE